MRPHPYWLFGTSSGPMPQPPALTFNAAGRIIDSVPGMSPRRFGNFDQSSATSPATCAEDIDAPLKVLYTPFWMLERMFTPGADTSGLMTLKSTDGPRLLKLARVVVDIGGATGERLEIVARRIGRESKPGQCCRWRRSGRCRPRASSAEPVDRTSGRRRASPRVVDDVGPLGPGAGSGRSNRSARASSAPHAIRVASVQLPVGSPSHAIQRAPGATPIWLAPPSSPTIVPIVCVPWPCCRTAPGTGCRNHAPDRTSCSCG